MSRHLTTAVVATLLLPACAGGPAGPAAGPSATTPATSPAGLPATSPAATPASATARPPSPSAPRATGTRVAVYYLGPGGGSVPRPVLYREFREVDRRAGAVHAAVDAMLHLRPLDTDYESLWPRRTRVNGVSVHGDVATVDLSAAARARGASSTQEEASVQQLVHTVTAAAPGVRGVRLRFDGRTADSLWGHVDTTGTLRRAPHSRALGWIWVVEPAYGSRVPRTFTATGTSSTFEGVFEWHVTRPGSRTRLAHGVARGGAAPSRGSYSVTVELPPGTTGTVVFTAFESSEKDGSVLDSDTKTYRVA